MKQFFSLMLAAAWTMAVGAQELDTLAVYQLQEVQVKSTRAQKTTPMAFSQLQTKDLRRVNHGKDVPHVLGMMPSVTTSSDAGAGIGYTGIHVRGTDPTRINVTTNGIPMNDSESAQLYWVNLGDLTSSMQSIQLQRGVGTSTNGAGAFGASLNMQTENLGVSPYLSVDLSGGSYGTAKGTMRFSSGLLGGHWAVQGRLSGITSDGYIDRAFSHLCSYFFQAGYFADNTMLKLVSFGGKERTYMAWDYASKEQMKEFGRRYNPCGIYTDDNGNTAFYKNQTDNYAQLHNQLHLTQRLSDQFNLTAALHYTYGNGHYEQYKTGQKLYKYHIVPPTDGSKSDLVRQKKMNNNFFGAIASLNYDNHSGLQATLGGGWNRYDGDHYGKVIWLRNNAFAFDPSHSYYDNNARKTDANVYGKVNYELARGLFAFVDLQYRHISYTLDGLSQEYDDAKQQRPLVMDRTYNFFNPKAGLTWQLSNGHTLYASYAIAHKEPTRNDFEDMLAETDEVDPKAERLNDLEVGYKYTSERFSASANFYWMDYDNQFVLTGAQDSNGEMVARNIKGSYRLGVELAAEWRPFNGFEWAANATWSRNRAKNMVLTVINPDWSQQYVNVGSTHLAYSPDWIVGNTLSYEWKGFRLAAMTKFISEQYMTNSGFRRYLNTDEQTYTSAMLSSVCTTDIDLSYTFRVRHLKALTVGAIVYNLFSKKFDSNGSCSMNYRLNNGRVEAYDGGWAWSTYSAQAPVHFLAYVSVTL